MFLQQLTFAYLKYSSVTCLRDSCPLSRLHAWVGSYLFRLQSFSSSIISPSHDEANYVEHTSEIDARVVMPWAQQWRRKALKPFHPDIWRSTMAVNRWMALLLFLSLKYFSSACDSMQDHTSTHPWVWTTGSSYPPWFSICHYVACSLSVGTLYVRKYNSCWRRASCQGCRCWLPCSGSR